MLTPSATDNPAGQKIAHAWIAIWNGEFQQAETLLAPDIRLHFAGTLPLDHSADAVHTPQQVVELITRFRSDHPQARLDVDTPVVADRSSVAVRWRMYWPGYDVGGIDVLQLAQDRITDVWSVMGARPFPS